MSRDHNFYGLGADEDPQTAPAPAAPEPWYTAVLRTTLPVLASTYQQQQLAKLNIERAKQGLSPIDAQTYARQYQVPAAQVQVGPTQEAQRLIIWGGAALVGLLALRALKR